MNKIPSINVARSKKPAKAVGTGKSPVIYNKDGITLLDETLFRDRHIYLHTAVKEDSCDLLLAQLQVLDTINHNPIYLHINSPGGYVSWGFALIDFIQSLKSKVVAVGSGTIASMGTVIFISARERHCYKNTTFMFHDIFSGVSDYGQKMEARIDFQKREWLVLVDHIRKHTKLTEEDLAFMRSGELWLFADEAIKKGVADKII